MTWLLQHQGGPSFEHMYGYMPTPGISSTPFAPFTLQSGQPFMGNFDVRHQLGNYANNDVFTSEFMSQGPHTQTQEEPVGLVRPQQQQQVQSQVRSRASSADSQLHRESPRSASFSRHGGPPTLQRDPPSGGDLAHDPSVLHDDPFVPEDIFPEVEEYPPTNATRATHRPPSSERPRLMDRPLIRPVVGVKLFDTDAANKEIGKLLRHHFRGSHTWTTTSRSLRELLWREFGV